LKLWNDRDANAKMIGTVVAILVTIIVSILIVYNVASTITFDTATERDINEARGYTTAAGNRDGYNNSTAAGNSTDDILDQAGTFFAIAPIIAVVIVAVVVLSYVGKI